MSQSLADIVPFAKTLGIHIVEASPEKVVGTLLVRPELCTTQATLHGGAIMSFADTLGATGAYLALPDGAKGTTTIESKTNFLSAPAAGTTVTGTATPIRIGRRLSVWQTDIRGEDGKRVALITQGQLVL